MMEPEQMIERHTLARVGWLRATVLGANDGIVSTASLIVGITAAAFTTGAALLPLDNLSLGTAAA